MKIYTGRGDDGSTGLLGGQRVSKSHVRVDCCGAIDEVNAALGLAAVAATPEMRGAIQQAQNELFVIGSHLAVADGTGLEAGLPPLEEASIARLESQIDLAEAALPPLRAFILPGGSEAAARLHMARTTCRRAERVVVACAQERPVEKNILTYLNRLGDWLFVQARLANHLAGVSDVPWTK